MVELARPAAYVPHVRLRPERERDGAHVRPSAPADQAAVPDQRPAADRHALHPRPRAQGQRRSTCRCVPRAARGDLRRRQPCGPPGPRRRGPLREQAAPRGPAFDEADISDKPPWLRDQLTHHLDGPADRGDHAPLPRATGVVARRGPRGRDDRRHAARHGPAPRDVRDLHVRQRVHGGPAPDPDRQARRLRAGHGPAAADARPRHPGLARSRASP